MNETEKNRKKIEDKITKETIIIFDFDGTLINTDFANYLAYNKAVKSVLNKSVPFEINVRFTREKLKNLFPEFTKKQYDDIVKKKELFYKDFLSETKPNKMVCEILNIYSKSNVTILVTNCRKDRALLTLNYYNMVNKFNGIFYKHTNGTIKINKYQNAITKLNISPLSILVFENEQSEISDAIDAGIPIKNIINLDNYQKEMLWKDL